MVAADIRACVTYAKAEYKPTSLGLVGFCYGGGRALEEAAAGETGYNTRKYYKTPKRLFLLERDQASRNGILEVLQRGTCANVVFIMHNKIVGVRR